MIYHTIISMILGGIVGAWFGWYKPFGGIWLDLGASCLVTILASLLVVMWL